jgi:hypothetical protein
MKFNSERDLQRLLARDIRRPEFLTPRLQWWVKRECMVGVVIPDLVAIGLPPTWVRPIHRRRPPSFLECAILADIANHTNSNLLRVSERTFTATPRLREVARALESHGLVHTLSSGELKLRRGAIPRQAVIIAVEAKLSRRGDAVRQAATYKAFANRSFVLLPTSDATRIRPLTLACRSNGLGVLSAGSRLGVVLSAPSRRLQSAAWLYLVFRAAHSLAHSTNSVLAKGVRPRTLMPKLSSRVPTSHLAQTPGKFRRFR